MTTVYFPVLAITSSIGLACLTGCRSSTCVSPKMDGQSRGQILELRIVLPDDCYQRILLTKATVASGDMLRGDKFANELKKQLRNQTGLGQHYLSANDPLTFTVKNVSSQVVLFNRRCSSVAIKVQVADRSMQRITCAAKPRAESPAYGFRSLVSPYEDDECITLLKPGDCIVGAITPRDYDNFPGIEYPKDMKDWCLTLEMNIADTIETHIKRTGVNVFSGQLLSDEVKVDILPTQEKP